MGGRVPGDQKVVGGAAAGPQPPHQYPNIYQLIQKRNQILFLFSTDKNISNRNDREINIQMYTK